MTVLLIGAGPMADDYAAVLLGLGVQFEAVCRSPKSANLFSAKHNVKCSSKGLSAYLKTNGPPSFAIVSVAIQDLYKVTKELLSYKVKEILIEKPGALFYNEIQELTSLSKVSQCNIFIAYNRRFYSSVATLKDLIKKDGGLTSVNFDFTEWSDRIAPLSKAKNVKERWVLSNSSHVIDLAFYLAGQPIKKFFSSSGSLGWHPESARFVGAGITRMGVTFSYHADWDAPGRWAITAFTKNFKFELCPLECLRITERNSLISKEENLDNELDLKYKPGLYRQVESFLGKDKVNLCSIAYHEEMFQYYLDIAGYNPEKIS